MKGNRVLELIEVQKEYVVPGTEVRQTILRNISLSIYQGDTLVITGPSGSGKSTLLNLIGALEQPDQGKVYFNDQDLSSLNDNDLSYIRNQKIGFIFQMHHLMPQLTVLENVLLPVIPFKKEEMGVYSKRALKLLEKVGLEKRINHKPEHLSGGEQLRTAIARALINEPELLLADEPTGSLDNKTAEEIGSLLSDLNRESKMTLLAVTHSLSLAGMMKRRYELRNGELIMDKRP